MNFARRSRLFPFVSSSGWRFLATNGPISASGILDKSCVEFYMKIFNLSHKATKSLLVKQPCLYSSSVNLDDVQNSADFISSLNISREDFKKYPTSLLIHKLSLENRLAVLKECSFNKIELLYLHRFVLIMGKRIEVLKANNLINQDVRVAEALVKFFDRPIKAEETLNDSLSLRDTRKALINLYLKERLQMGDQEMQKLWKTYTRITYRSLKSIVDVLDLFENHIGFTKEKIARNGYLIYACPDNIRKILKDLPTIGGLDSKHLLLISPKVALTSAKALKETIQHVKDFNIPEDRILNCKEILTLGPQTVKERLQEFSKIDDFHVLVGNEGILRLIHNQNKAKIRLDFLKKEIKVKCISLSVLSGPSANFEKYAMSGRDKTKGYDVLQFLDHEFDVDKEELYKILNRHPNWRCVPAVDVKQAIEYLRSQNFSDQDMLDNIHLLLYPVFRIQQKLSSLMELRTKNGERHYIAGEPLSELSNSKLLNLCFYYIEAEFNFSGDGMWGAGRNDGRQDVPTTPIQFPDTLKKVNRFNVKPKEKKAVLLN